jgi:hypothetical protein
MILTVRLKELPIFLRNYRDCKAVALKEYYNYSPISNCTEKVSIFLSNDSDCEDVDHLYNTRKRYAVIESSDLTRNITWLESCFSKIKKPNMDCSGNQSMIAGVCIFDTISYIYP